MPRPNAITGTTKAEKDDKRQAHYDKLRAQLASVLRSPGADAIKTELFRVMRQGSYDRGRDAVDVAFREGQRKTAFDLLFHAGLIDDWNIREESDGETR